MLIVITMSAVSVAACLVTLSRVVGWTAIFRYATLVDVAFTIVLAWFFAGTLTGALVAVLGGLVMALVLSGAKWCMQASDAAVRAVKTSSAPVSFQLPAGADPDEYDEHGNWVYNTHPFTRTA